jgi:RTX calcium-binding nonapeptide repeat (4 copies)
MAFRRKRRVAFVVVAVLAPLMLTAAGPAQAKRFLGTKGADRLVGTPRADVIKAGRGNDRITGRGGRDRLLGGRGADRLNAVDGRRDRAVRGGPGRDVCRIDATDRVQTRGCETVRIGKGRGPGGGGPGGGGPGGGGPGGGGPGGGGPGGGLGCASAPDDALAAGEPAHAAGDAPPTFSDPFYATTITLNASADGLDGDALPISIEEVCDVPQQLQSEAAQLIGGDGFALIGAQTTVFDAAGQQLTGDAATTALGGADTVSLTAQLLRPAQWRQDEDGEPVPTFAISRADITD